MNLAAYLDETGESQGAFAKRAGLSDSTVSRVLNARTAPSPDAIEKIDAATDGRVTANDLFAAWRAATTPPTDQPGA